MKRLTTLLALSLGLGMASAQTQKAKDYFNASEPHAIFKEHDDVIKYVNLAIKEDPSYADAYYRRGTSYYALGKYDLAEKDFLRLTKLDKENAMVYYNLGMISEKKNEHKKAEDYYKKIYLIHAYSAQSIADDLVKDAQKMFINYVNSLQSTDIQDNSIEIKESFRLVNRAILIDPLTPSHISTLADFQWHLKKYTETIETYKRMLDLKSDKVDRAGVHIKIGEIYGLKKELATRDEYFKKALSLDPDKISNINASMALNLNKVLPEEQLEYVQRWNDLMPKEYMPKLVFGAYYSNQGEFKKALDYFDQAIEIDDSLTEAYQYRGSAYHQYAFEQNNVNYLYNAYEDYTQAIEKGANTPNNYFARGRILYIPFETKYNTDKKANKEMADDILKDIDAIIAIDDKYAHAYQLRASVNYILNGEKETADVLKDMELHDQYCKEEH